MVPQFQRWEVPLEFQEPPERNTEIISKTGNGLTSPAMRSREQRAARLTRKSKTDCAAPAALTTSPFAGKASRFAQTPENGSEDVPRPDRAGAGVVL
jgi:hypothetical protein